MTDASLTTYSSTDPTDWDDDANPGNTDHALDQLAARQTTIEAVSRMPCEAMYASSQLSFTHQKVDTWPGRSSRCPLGEVLNGDPDTFELNSNQLRILKPGTYDVTFRVSFGTSNGSINGPYGVETWLGGSGYTHLDTSAGYAYSGLDVGEVFRDVDTITGDFDMSVWGGLPRDVLLCDAGSSTITVDLPPVASLSNDKQFNFKKIDATANTVTIRADGSETIDSSNTQTLTAQYETMSIVSDGTQWWILSS